MSYIHLATLRYPVSVRDIKAENPNTSFPDTFSAPPEYAEVARTQIPEIDTRTERVEEGQPVLIDGAWTQQWVIVPRTAEEIRQMDAEAASGIRALRDGRLAQCDWVVIKAIERGEPVPAAWASYRQSLRDITAQAGFPLTVTWPAEPI